MLRKTMSVAVALLLAFTSTAAQASDIEPRFKPQVSTAAAGTQVVVTLGDSRSITGQWQQTFCSELQTNANITCDLRNLAVSGTTCDYWVPRIQNVLVTHNPDILILACGTNNDANTQAGRDQLGAAWRTIMETVYQFRTNPRVKIVPVLISYADAIRLTPATAWVGPSEPWVNDTIYFNSMYYSPYGWFPGGFIDWQILPNNPPYMRDSLHPSDLGEWLMGKVAYRQLAPGFGWPAPSSPVTCGLYGGRYPYGRYTGPGSQPCVN